jgi:hypothetical protein
MFEGCLTAFDRVEGLFTIGGQSDHDQAEEDLYKAHSVNPGNSHFEYVVLVVVVVVVGIAKR